MGKYIKIKAFTPILTGVGIVFLVSLLMISGLKAEGKEISDGVLRLHIVASGNSKAEQEAKLAVRDRILNDIGYLFKDCADAEASRKRATEIKGMIERVARDELLNRGIIFPVTVKIEETKFPTKRYGKVRLPAGEYSAVNVKIGAAAGENWWCVLYPPLCITGGVAEVDKEALLKLKSELTPAEYALVTQEDEIRINMRFKILEFIQTHL